MLSDQAAKRCNFFLTAEHVAMLKEVADIRFEGNRSMALRAAITAYAGALRKAQSRPQETISPPAKG